MKLFLRMFYIFILIMIGMNIYGNAIIEKEQNFFLNETLKSINDENKELYLNNTMVSLEANEYIKEPIYKFISNNDNKKFEFEVYHFKITDKNENVYGLAFYLNNIKLISELKDLDILFYSNSDNNFLEEKVGFEFEGEKFNSNLVYALLLKDKYTNFENSKSINEIKDIDIKQNNELLFRISHNDNFLMKENNESYLTDNGIYLNTNNFNGNIKEYNYLKDFYKDENNIKKVNYDTFNSYQKIVTKNIISYSVVAVIGTALVFLMEPFIKFVKGRKK